MHKLCHYCQKVSKLLHIFSQQITLLKWPSRISRALTLYLLVFACKGRIKELENACVVLASLRASVRAVKVVTHQLTERTEHTSGDVVVSPDTRIDDATAHMRPDTAAFSNTSLHLLLCAMASGEQNTRLAPSVARNYFGMMW